MQSAASSALVVVHAAQQVHSSKVTPLAAKGSCFSTPASESCRTKPVTAAKTLGGYLLSAQQAASIARFLLCTFNDPPLIAAVCLVKTTVSRPALNRSGSLRLADIGPRLRAPGCL